MMLARTQSYGVCGDVDCPEIAKDVFQTGQILLTRPTSLLVFNALLPANINIA